MSDYTVEHIQPQEKTIRLVNEIGHVVAEASWQPDYKGWLFAVLTYTGHVGFLATGLADLASDPDSDNLYAPIRSDAVRLLTVERILRLLADGISAENLREAGQ